MLKYLSLIFLVAPLAACHIPPEQPRSPNVDIAQPGDVNPEFVSSGGVAGDQILCPASPRDVIVPLESLDPAPLPGEPEMTIDGLHQFIHQHGITDIAELMRAFPVHFKTNFSLVETTRATGMSTLDYPRIILFGSDGHLLMNIGTLKEDPKYQMLDIAELNAKTGQWEFSAFDFSGEQPTLNRHDPECLTCHAANNPRPIWGTNADWPGVFGDNIAEGPQGEALDGRHVIKLNQWIAGKTDSERMQALIFRSEPVRRGGMRRIAHHILGGELLLSNIAIGSAAALGAFRTIQTAHNRRYRKLREAILLLGIEHMRGGSLTAPVKHKITSQIHQYGGHGDDLDALLSVLGLDTSEAFSLATLDDREPPAKDWKMARGDLYEQLLMLVLDDLATDNPHVERILRRTTPGKTVFRCSTLAHNVRDLIDYKKLHLYDARGQARYQINQVYYAADMEVIYSAVLEPVANELILHLSASI